jgi:polyphosphate kinase
VTASQFTDLGLFTCDTAMGADASDLFNYLTGYSSKQDYQKFLVAPFTLRTGIKELIEREIEHRKKGHEAHIIFKLNFLVDRPITQLLYRASQAGVKVDLLIRGMCCLRPGLPGISENIRVVSVVGRFLEHSRIFYFRNGGNETVLLGSADLMVRNLDRRVEILFPVEEPRLVRHLHDQVLGIYLADNVKARVMQSDGNYQHLVPTPETKTISSQEWLLKHRAATK